MDLNPKVTPTEKELLKMVMPLQEKQIITKTLGEGKIDCITRKNDLSGVFVYFKAKENTISKLDGVEFLNIIDKVIEPKEETFEKIDELDEFPENHFYAKWIGDEFNGRWNVVQVLGDSARCFVLKSSKLETNAETGPFLSHGWIKDDCFTDGEDVTTLDDWDHYQGILISY